MRSLSEEVDLLPAALDKVVTNHKWHSRMKCCFKSKAALLILLWNFAALLLYILIGMSSIFKYGRSFGAPIAVTICVSIFAPIAGLLTDLKYSKYKTTMCSAFFVLIGVVVFLLVIVSFLASVKLNALVNYRFGALEEIAVALFAVLMLIVIVILVINSIRFGMDQLHDSPTEDSILFIHWYVWIYYLCFFITSLPWIFLNYDTYHNDYRLTVLGASFAILIISSVALLLLISQCLIILKKTTWFLIEPPGVNPYKLVFGITKFAYKHKIPLRRSAFTFCENDLPSRMDLGKQKYGGPFSTKEVEEVKAFWGILKIVTSIGPMYMLHFAAQSILPIFALHNEVYRITFIDGNTTKKQDVYFEGIARHILLCNNLLSPLLVVVSIPLYLSLLRPRIVYHIPGSLKRIGMAIVLIILSLVTSLAMDVAVHEVERNVGCMFSGFTGQAYTIVYNSNTTAPLLYQSAYFFAIQQVLSAATNMLMDIAVLEFILSQSPYSMKGLLLGYFFSMKGLFRAISIASIFPFGLAWNVEALSCGSGFYLMNIIIGIVILVVFSVMARRYEYRTINEPSNEYRYAEEYYSNIQ